MYHGGIVHYVLNLPNKILKGKVNSSILGYGVKWRAFGPPLYFSNTRSPLVDAAKTTVFPQIDPTGTILFGVQGACSNQGWVVFHNLKYSFALELWKK